MCIEATSRTGALTNFYFDVKTGLLLRQDDDFYEDYREVDGVLCPFTIRNANTLIKLTEVKHNVAVDDARFIEEKNCFTQ